MAEDKDEVKENQEEKPKKSKLKLIIIGVIVLLLGAGGFFGYSKYKKANEKEAEKEEQVSIIIPLKSFVVNLFDKKGIGKRYLKVSMEIEVGKEEDKLKIDNNMPQLRDTILILLSSQTLKDINTMEGKLELKHAILLRINQILGKKTVRRIFFTEFVVQ
ncbi:MAG: flagellar basal body-associated FliL family protein [Thermodesulfobacteriota bacterium]|nr:flagellar basal body-associated FliL family protein [Thermodesulfobacteriota bacterium]